MHRGFPPRHSQVPFWHSPVVLGAAQQCGYDRWAHRGPRLGFDREARITGAEGDLEGDLTAVAIARGQDLGETAAAELGFYRKAVHGRRAGHPASLA